MSDLKLFSIKTGKAVDINNSIVVKEQSVIGFTKTYRKMNKETKKNILQGAMVMVLFCTALCAVFSLNDSKKNKLSATAVVCGVSGLVCSAAGYIKNPYRGRQRS